MLRGLAIAATASVLIACTSRSAATDGADGGDAGASSADPGAVCGAPGSALAGVAYDVTKSRFAFGGKPVQNGLRWIGTDGTLVDDPYGTVIGIMNAKAPESALPDWSNDPTALTAHVVAYWEAMGVPACQIMRTQILAEVGPSGGSRTVELQRGLEAIPIAESTAQARMNNADQSTFEQFRWPEIPADTVTSARAFRDVLADPAQKTAYLAKLPAAARTAPGAIVIHHSRSGTYVPGGFAVGVTYDVQLSEETQSFDPDGNPAPTTW